MKYAASMLYGGQLIDSADCDYESYKNLGLLCGNCKEPVFLQAVSTRQVRGSNVEIPAHFKHFKAKDPALAKVCEARVAQYDASEIQRRAAQARNQRVRLLQRRFWLVFTTYYENKLSFPITNILESDGQQDFIKEMSRALSDVFLVDKLDRYKALTLQLLEAGFNETHVMFTWNSELADIGVSASTEIQYHFRKSLSGKLDRQMQELIASEVLEFLHSRSSRPLAERLFALACCVLLDAMGDGAKLGLIAGDGSDWVKPLADGGRDVNSMFWAISENREIFYHYAYSHVCLWLGMLPWALEMRQDKG